MLNDMYNIIYIGEIRKPQKKWRCSVYKKIHDKRREKQTSHTQGFSGTLNNSAPGKGKFAMKIMHSSARP